MKVSELYAPTLREVPAEAEIPSHQLLLRAGFMRKTSGGIYTLLPLGLRVIRKIEKIINEEMEAKGAQEVLMPILQPGELWKESGRWDAYGAEMWRVKDRHGNDYCLGPTHEELITSTVRTDVRSYRQLPLMLFQTQDKFRDERRPRFGLMRSREFIMKDCYSFDVDEAGLDVSYKKMYDAYDMAFKRCGLYCRPVEADSGAIGGSGSHEFMALAQSGEAEIAYCTECSYAADVEKAELNPEKMEAEEAREVEKVTTPGCKTIEAVCEYLHLPVDHSVKAVAYQSEEGKLILCFVRGDHEVNEVKVVNAAGVRELEMATPELLANAGTVGGYMGPKGLDSEKTIIICDQTVMAMHNVCCGANEEGYHFIGIEPQRDFKPTIVADIRLAKAGDSCPRCGGKLETARGIEVGQVFKLHTKYSEPMKATFLDESGKSKPMVMGCYGIGVGRTMAAAVEQFNDKDGIIWPASIAPYQVIVIAMNPKDAESFRKAEMIYEEFERAGVEVIFDDRKERPGVKFKDADLIGYPIRVVVGPKTLANGSLEVKARRTGEVRMLPLDGDYVAAVREWLKEL